MVLWSTVSTLKDGATYCKNKISNIIGRNERSGNLSVNPDRRRFIQQAGATAAVASVGTAASSGSASAYTAVGPDLITCEGTSRTDDTELPWDTGGNYGGWRATEHFGVSGGSVDETPVVFVHGNNGDACNFEEHAQHLLNSGWDGDELYAITFENKAPYHTWMRDELDAFVQQVKSETGSAQVNVVAHSLGVTGARFWMDDLDRFDWVETFVGLNGGNHGVCVCPGCYDTSLEDDYNQWLAAGKSCQFIAVQCFADPDHPLYELNLPSETPGDVEYHTVRGFWDPLYYCNPWSPYLDGADNNLIYRNHTSSLVDDGTKADVDEWCSTDQTVDSDQPAITNVVDTDDYGDTVWRATIRQGATTEDLEFALVNPSGNVADDRTLYDGYFDDEDYTVELQMNEYDGVAEPGTWRLEVTYQDKSGTFYTKEKSFEPNGITLTDSRYWIQGDSSDADLEEMEFEFRNDGDLPLYVTKIEARVDGYTEYLYPDETLRPGDADTFRDDSVGTDLGDEFATNYDVDITVEVNDTDFATAEDTVYPTGKIAVVDRNFDAAGDDSENLNDEYVVFENVGDGTLEMDGWSVEDEAGYTYAVPSGFSLDPGAQVTLHTGSGTDTATDLYWGRSSSIWNNTGDTVYVFDDAGGQRIPDVSGLVSVTNVHADAEGSDTDNLNDEYVDLKNDSGGSLDMTGWTVEDDAGNTYQFPDGWAWSDGDAVRLHSGSDTDSSSDLYWGSSSAIWNNSGDTVFVFDDGGTKIAQHTY